MPIRCFSLILLAVTASAQTSPFDGPALEAAQKATPDDPKVSAQLLRYYETENQDPDWSKRFALLSWNVEHHPDAAFLSSSATWQSMPQAFRDQLTQMWVAQVHQHADNPRVLRNAAAALDTSSSTKVRVGSRVAEANLIRKVAPEYPPLAKQARIQGTVRFNVTISPEGQMENIQLVSGHPLLAAAAQQAVQQWLYKPTLLNGNPVAVITTVDVEFTLQQ